MRLDEEYARFPSVQECPREDCNATGEPFTIDTENYGGPRVVWTCRNNHVFSTDMHGQGAQT